MSNTLSKEEILNSKWVALNNKESDPEMHLYLSIDEMDMIHEAMDEYAQQEAIGFDVWKMKNNYTWTLDNNDNMIWYNVIDFVAYRFYSHEELYNLYLKSKENGKN